MYGALLLPMICDQLWFSMRMIQTVLMCGVVVCVADGMVATSIARASDKTQKTARESFMFTSGFEFQKQDGGVGFPASGEGRGQGVKSK